MFFDLSNLVNKPIFYLSVPFVFAFVFTALLLPFYIRWLKNLQIGQFIRQDGPASHLAKAKTPTMGGVIFILVVSASLITFSVLTHHFSLLALAAIILAIACGLLGLTDDLAKFVNRANKGLSASSRLLLEAGLGALLALFLIYIRPHANDLIVSMSSFISGINLTTAHVFTLPHIIFIILAILVIASTTNSVNLNDGMDGLASGVALPIFLTLSIMLMKTNNISLALLAMSGAGVSAAFLLFNCYPAKIFMGDVGSLFLGGLMGSLVLAGGLTLWLIPLATIYILETLSVIIQVSVFKLTKPYEPARPMNMLSLATYKLTHKLPGEGKRIFRMAPLHHHFEALLAEKGVQEWQVVLGFWLAQLVICLIVLVAFARF